jgi:hypothetical protein
MLGLLPGFSLTKIGIFAMSRSAYGTGRRTNVRARRILVVLDPDEFEESDRWAIGAGEPTRAAALRTLLARGLKSAKRASGKRPQD